MKINLWQAHRRIWKVLRTESYGLEIKYEDQTGSLFISDYESSSSYKMLSEFPKSTYDLTHKAQNQVLFIFSLLVLYQFLILTYNVQCKLRCICREKDYFWLRLLWLSNQIQQSNSPYCEILRKGQVYNENLKK